MHMKLICGKNKFKKFIFEMFDNLYKVFGIIEDNTDYLQIHSLRLEREGAKLLRLRNPAHIAVETLCTTTLCHARTIATLSPIRFKNLVNTCSDLNARSLITLVQWLQTDPKYLGQLTTKLKLIGQEETGSVGHVVNDVMELLEMEKSREMWRKSSDPDDDEEESKPTPYGLSI